MSITTKSRNASNNSSKSKKSFVNFKDVKKTYDGDKYVVKKLNLTLQNGEFLTLLGSSGSGKTTCLMMLAGFEDVTSGEILIDNQSIKNLAPHKRNIGMVFQNYALFPHMTVGENLEYPLKFRNVKKKDRQKKVTEYLDLVELGAFKNRAIGQLSGGQKQRIALARALIYQPKLVLMDEPLGALDKNLREQMQYEIKRLHKLLGFTVVYVTHDQSEALTMSDRIAVFDDGVVQQVATPQELYEHPTNSFVAEFIGENNHFNLPVLKFSKNEVILKAGKNKVLATPASAKEGENTYVSIRPERIEINPTKKLENTFDATISNIIYIGDLLRFYIAIKGWDVNFIVKRHNLGNMSTLKSGDKVKIGFSKKDCQALSSSN